MKDFSFNYITCHSIYTMFSVYKITAPEKMKGPLQMFSASRFNIYILYLIFIGTCLSRNTIQQGCSLLNQVVPGSWSSHSRRSTAGWLSQTRWEDSAFPDAVFLDSAYCSFYKDSKSGDCLCFQSILFGELRSG